MSAKTLKDGNEQGLVNSVIDSGAELAEQTAVACFGVMNTVREETNKRVEQAFDWIEAAQQGAMRVSRDVQGRIDRLSSTTIEQSERTVLNFIRVIRDTSHEATEVAVQVGPSVVGRPNVKRAPSKTAAA